MPITPQDREDGRRAEDDLLRLAENEPVELEEDEGEPEHVSRYDLEEAWGDDGMDFRHS